MSSFKPYNFLDMIVAAAKMASFAHDEISNCLHYDTILKFERGAKKRKI